MAILQVDPKIYNTHVKNAISKMKSCTTTRLIGIGSPQASFFADEDEKIF